MIRNGDTTSGSAAAVRVSDLHKSFGGVPALRGASLTLTSGETTGLVGENGAGKSTLVKVLAGVHLADSGTLQLDGAEVEFRSPADSLRAGIAVIHQEPTLFPDLTVAENIFMGSQPLRRGLIGWRVMRSRAAELLGRLDSTLSPSALVSSLSIAEQQIVDIAKALSQDAKVLVMDEPTAALSGAEVKDLLALVRQLNQRGVAILYISHRLDEVLAVSHRITVLRDGATVADARASEFDENRIVSAMVGRELSEIYPALAEPVGGTRLAVEGLSRTGEYRDVSFTVDAGEIVGLAGLIGAGRTELARTIFGLTRADAGRVLVSGTPLRGGDSRRATRAGVAYVPEDRRQHGLVLPFTIASNVSMAALDAFSRFGLVSRRREQASALDYITALQVRATGPDQQSGTLSGGNQQKVVLAKWLVTKPSVLILDEPTRGVDVGAKAEVYRIIAELAEQGLAVVLISSELPEVLAMSHRILVFREGRVAGELARDDADEAAVMKLATRATAVVS